MVPRGGYGDVVYSVRPAQQNEAQAVEAVFNAAGLIPYGDPLQIDEPTFVAVESDSLLGAVEGRFDAGEYPAGCLLADAPSPRAWIDRIGVLPSAHGRGIGKSLVRAFAEAAATKGCRHTALMVDESTDRAMRIEFFTRCGLFPLRTPGAPPDAHMGARR
jgi:GNAT superfamily N-acetyltransferase